MFTEKIVRIAAVAALTAMLAGCTGSPQTAQPETEDAWEQTVYQDAMFFQDDDSEMEACKLLMQIRDYEDAPGRMRHDC